MGSFKTDVKRGLKWTTIATVVNSLVKLFQVSILTRFLLKEDFGTIAIASLFIGFTDLFTDMGISTAILHKQNITKKEYSSLFWLNVFSGIILTILMILLAPIASYAYDDHSLTLIIQLLSLNIFFSSVGLQHKTIQRKNLNFKFISIVDIIVSCLTMIVAVLFAISGFGVYSLVYSTLFNVFILNSIYFVYGLKKNSNICLHFDFNETLSFLKIGIYQIGSSVLDFFAREFDIIIISAVLGKETLGIYTLCKRIVSMLYTISTSVLSRVLTPVFSQIQSNIIELRSKYIKIVKILSLTSFPLFGLVAMCSPLILEILYGYDYVEGKWVLSYMSASYGILCIASMCGSVQIALGRTDIGFYWTIYRILSNCVAIYLGSLFSLNGIAIALFIYNLLNIYPFWYIQINKMLNISFHDYLSPQFIPFIICLFLTIVCGAFVFYTESIIISILCIIVYVLFYFCWVHKNKYDLLVLSILKK